MYPELSGPIKNSPDKMTKTKNPVKYPIINKVGFKLFNP